MTKTHHPANRPSSHETPRIQLTGDSCTPIRAYLWLYERICGELVPARAEAGVIKRSWLQVVLSTRRCRWREMNPLRFSGRFWSLGGGATIWSS